MVGLGGRILGIVAASSTRGGSGKGQPIVVPLSSGLLDEIIDRTKNRSSVLRVAPDTPIAGREVSFTLKAEPGQIVRIGHLNPDGKKVAWVFPNGSTRSEDDEPIIAKNRGSDESGIGLLDQARYARFGGQMDGPGGLRSVYRDAGHGGVPLYDV